MESVAPMANSSSCALPRSTTSPHDRATEEIARASSRCGRLRLPDSPCQQDSEAATGNDQQRPRSLETLDLGYRCGAIGRLAE